mmetsp:Transcript_8816/g.19785  ORF Transcript_8816/g.19785 Transcript_8816/m.19785 type:complete len:412 (+) Transcript_8816:182-1417(+)
MSNSNIIDLSHIVGKKRAENTKSHVHRWSFGKANPVLLLLVAFAIINCFLVRSLFDSETPEATGDVSKSPAHETLDFGRSNSIISNDNVFVKRPAHETVDFGRSNGTVSNDNDFIKQFRNAIISDSLFSVPGGVIPFILQNGTLLCRRIHRTKIRQHTRSRAVAEMIHTGLKWYKHRKLDRKMRSELPLIFLINDSQGCDIKTKQDNFKIPRLTWSYPSPKYGKDWCNAIPAPSYVSWDSFHKEHKSHSSWKSTFASYSRLYPWSSKINKAVWRGTTTYNPYFGAVELNKTPRGELVQKSMEYPEIIDAGFVKFIQQYKSQKDELANQTVLTKRMNFDDQMKYKTILDIDGNNWSGRFPRLLCTNSVVIKVHVYDLIICTTQMILTMLFIFYCTAFVYRSSQTTLSTFTMS